MLGLIHKAGVL